MHLKYLITALIAALFLAGCATKMRTDVTRFHELSAPQGRTFKVAPLDPSKEGGLEFREYAGMVAGYLQREGFRRAAGASPDLIVKLDYYTSGPIQRTRRESYPGPLYGGAFYYGYPYYHWPYWYGTHFPYWGYGFSTYYPYEYSYTVYDSTLVMVIERAGGRIVFEGRASGTSRAKNLTETVPALIEAMFTDFPGASGETLTVRVPMEGGGASY